MKLHDNSNTLSLCARFGHRQFAAYHLDSNGVSPSKNSSFQHKIDGNISGYSESKSDDDVITFLEEETEADVHTKAVMPWKILIADDDSSVHDTTLLALLGVRIHDRPLEFLHAYSAKEAYKVILENPDLSLVLLDVVMETIDAGLKLVGVIRNELARSDLRIVLRTGQPGYAPEQRVSNEFAIDGYTTKAQLTRSILISVLSDTLSSLSSSAPTDDLAN